MQLAVFIRRIFVKVAVFATEIEIRYRLKAHRNSLIGSQKWD